MRVTIDTFYKWHFSTVVALDWLDAVYHDPYVYPGLRRSTVVEYQITHLWHKDFCPVCGEDICVKSRHFSIRRYYIRCSDQIRTVSDKVCAPGLTVAQVCFFLLLLRERRCHYVRGFIPCQFVSPVVSGCHALCRLRFDHRLRQHGNRHHQFENHLLAYLIVGFDFEIQYSLRLQVHLR